MSNRVWPRTATILTLAVLLLLPGVASAAPSSFGPARLASPSQMLLQAWSFLASFWGEAGCRLDPDGAGVQSFVDVGCSLDPSGTGCAQDRPSTDVGCSLDPDGRCAVSR
jgi:hypothetical protein